MTPRARVSVIGLGPMGRAMAGVLLAAGHPVTVWNRTAARAQGLVAAGASVAATPADAVRASDLTLVSLTDYGAMYDILEPHTDALAGRVLVNLSSDTPDESRRAAAWAADHGAAFLTGGVMNPAPMIGDEDAYVYYSGPRSLFEAHEPLLRLLGDARHVGEDPGLAQLWYQAQLDVFLTTLAAILHATALVGSAGVTAAEFVPAALATVSATPAMIGGAERTARQLDTGHHPGDLSTVAMMGATAAHIVGASAAAAIDLELPRAIRSHYERAIASGRSGDDWTSLIDVMRRATG